MGQTLWARYEKAENQLIYILWILCFKVFMIGEGRMYGLFRTYFLQFFNILNLQKKLERVIIIIIIIIIIVPICGTFDLRVELVRVI